MNKEIGGSALSVDSFWNSPLGEVITSLAPVVGGALIGLLTALFLSNRANKRADLIYSRDRERERYTRWNEQTLSSAIDFRASLDDLMGSYEQLHVEREHEEPDLLHIAELELTLLPKILHLISVRNNFGFIASQATYSSATKLIDHVVASKGNPYDEARAKERNNLLEEFAMAVRTDIGAPDFDRGGGAA